MAFILNPDDSVTIDIATLRQIIRQAGSNFEAFFRTIAIECAKLLGADAAALIQPDDEGVLHYRFFHGLPEAFQHEVLAAGFGRDAGTAGHVMQSCQPLFTPDYPSSPHAMPDFVAFGLKANLVVPICSDEQASPVAVLTVSWFQHAPTQQPTSAQMELIMLYGDFLLAGLARQSMIDAWRQQANRDALTGLPNRRALMEYLPAALDRSARQGTSVAVCVMDLDDFKPVNDRFGHAAGDLLLMELAYRLRSMIRTTDLIARLGGDEFVVVLEHIESVNQMEQAVQRIHQVVDAPFVLPDSEAVHVGMSIGITLYPQDNSSPACLLRHADHALYYIKDNRKKINRCWILWQADRDPDPHHCIEAE